MRKVRVYQLARELKVTNQAVLELLVQLGTPVTSHAASVDAEVAEQVRGQLAGSIRKSRESVATATATEKVVPAEVKKKAAPARSIRASRRVPEEDLLPALSLATLNRAPDFDLPTLVSSVVVPASPPGRHMGPAVPARQVVRPVSPRGASRSSSRGGGTRTHRPGTDSRPAPAAGGGFPGRGGPDRRRADEGDRRGKRGRRKKKKREVDERERAGQPGGVAAHHRLLETPLVPQGEATTDSPLLLEREEVARCQPPRPGGASASYRMTLQRGGGGSSVSFAIGGRLGVTRSRWGTRVDKER